MSQRRYKPYLKDTFLKQIQQTKNQWLPLPDPSLPSGEFYPINPELTNLFRDDEDTSRTLPGEKLTLSLAGVHYIWSDFAECTGTLQVTNYRLIFVADAQQPSNPNFYSTDPPVPQKSTSKGGGTETLPVYRPIPQDICVPLYTIEKVEHDPKQKMVTSTPISPVMYIDITCKDIREYRFGMPKLAEGTKAIALIQSFAFDTVPHHLYTFSLPKASFFLNAPNTNNPARYQPEENTKAVFPFVPGNASLTACIPEHLDGWRFYNPAQEYKRMGIPNDYFQVSNINHDYSLCPSYPNTLVIPQPEHVSEAEYRLCAKFRSKSRVPALTWKNPMGEQTIWRCSQPATGIANSRSAEDEKVLEFIGKSNKYNQNLTIIDCRPRANAYANNIRGFGFESEANYPTAQLKFMNIENIHEVRKSFKRLRKACVTQRYDQTFPGEVQQSVWLKHIQDILRATALVVKLVDGEGQSVLIRCSDGFDRTSQMSGLTKMCMDPYYRTIRGFCTLIDHDWLSFGHKFHDRYGHFDKNIKDERSPIFLQFLDCTYQLLNQFPRHFEFTSEFLVQIALHSFSSRFGTFLMNTEKERQFFKLKRDSPVQRIADVSVSLWTYLFCCPAAVRGDFMNAYYAPGGQGDPLDVIQIEHQAAIPSSFYTPDNAPLPGAELTDGLRFLRTEPVEGCLGVGSVLYPSYSSMKLTVWADYWFKFHFDLSNEFYHYAAPGATGNLFPGGATMSSLKSSAALFNAHMQWSQLISGSMSLRNAPQQIMMARLQEAQTQADANLVKMVQLLCEKDAMLQYYKNKYGDIDPSEHDAIARLAQQKQAQHLPDTSSEPTPPPTTLTPMEENALYIQQQQQYFLNRASYCVNLNELAQQQLQHQQNQQHRYTIEYDPLTGASFATTTQAPEESSSSTFVPKRFTQIAPQPSVPSRPKRPSPSPETSVNTSPLEKQSSHHHLYDAPSISSSISSIPPPPPQGSNEDDVPPPPQGQMSHFNQGNTIMNSYQNNDNFYNNYDNGNDSDDDNGVDLNASTNLDDDGDNDAEQMEAEMTEKRHNIMNLNDHLTKRLNCADETAQTTYFDDCVDESDSESPPPLASRGTVVSNNNITTNTTTVNSPLASAPQLSPNSKLNSLLNGPNALNTPGQRSASALFDLEDDEDDNKRGGINNVQVNNVFGSHKHDFFSSSNKISSPTNAPTSPSSKRQQVLHTFEDDHEDDDEGYESHHTPTQASRPTIVAMDSLSPDVYDPMAEHVLPDGEYDEEDQE